MPWSSATNFARAQINWPGPRPQVQGQRRTCDINGSKPVEPYFQVRFNWTLSTSKVILHDLNCEVCTGFHHALLLYLMSPYVSRENILSDQLVFCTGVFMATLLTEQNHQHRKGHSQTFCILEQNRALAISYVVRISCINSRRTRGNHNCNLPNSQIFQVFNDLQRTTFPGGEMNKIRI